MGAANGFAATTPDTRYGDSDYGNTTAYVDVARYQAPSSGALEVSEIGCYMTGATLTAKIAIFDDDAANGCPGAMVANSEGTLTVDSLTNVKASHTYSGTKPQVTGGSYYWIGVISDSTRTTSVFATGGTSLERGSVSYPTWPSGDDWHTHTDLTKDYSFYAVYAAAAAQAPRSTSYFTMNW